MSLFYIWLIAYAAPAIFAGATVKLLPPSKAKPSKRNAVIMHIALAVSVLLSQYFIYANGLSFPWYPNTFSILVYIVSVAIAVSLLGSMGFWYGLSALLQQATMLSMVFLLSPAYSLYLVVLLIVPLYAWCHALQVNHWLTRILLFLLWGIASIFLFSISQNLYLIAALHTLFGSLLISRSLLYPEA
jgi:hypothetical protein